MRSPNNNYNTGWGNAKIQGGKEEPEMIIKE